MLSKTVVLSKRAVMLSGTKCSETSLYCIGMNAFDVRVCVPTTS